MSKSKISTIKRMTGGVGYKKTKGTGTTVEEINRMRKDWEKAPMKGTPGPYNPATMRLKKKTTKKTEKPKTARRYIEEGGMRQAPVSLKNKAMREEAARQLKKAEPIVVKKPSTTTPSTTTTPKRVSKVPPSDKGVYETTSRLEGKPVTRPKPTTPRTRWPGTEQKRVSTKDTDVVETTSRLEGKPITLTLKQKHQYGRRLRALVDKYGRKWRDWWNEAKNRPMSEAEIRGQMTITELKRMRERGEHAKVLPAIKRDRTGGTIKRKSGGALGTGSALRGFGKGYKKGGTI